MKRIILNILSVLIIVLIVVMPVSASAEVSHYEEEFSLGFPDVDPCTGHDVFADFSGTAYYHDVINEKTGKINATYKVRSTLTSTDLVTGEITTGSVVWNHSELGGFDGPATYLYQAHITSPGPGNNVLLHVIFHISPNGMIDVDSSDMEHICPDLPGA